MTTFSDLNLHPKVLKAVSDAGYDTPTPIQAGAIPPALQGRDVLGIAQTGTGKTASFTLPLITALARGRARARMPRSLVLCPTRELAAQVAENFDIYAQHLKLTKALLIGGVSFKDQDILIDKGVDVLIATPGRLLDHFERGRLILNDVKIMVVDEADRMLDMGFIPDIERIFGLVPFTRQTLFFSATMAPEIERITNTFLSAPEKIEIARASSTSATIEQRLIEFKPTRKDQTAKQKRNMLRAAIEAEGKACTNAIIFCNRKIDVDIVAKSLKKHGLNAEPIHGDLDQSHRTRTLDGFRDGTIQFLVASDVAARGLDIPSVSHVFNYDIPSHAEDYVHRIGRTGRAGRKGVSISLCVPSDDKLLTAIEGVIGNSIPRADAPWTPEPHPQRDTPAVHADAAPRDDRKRNTKDRRRKDRGNHNGTTYGDTTYGFTTDTLPAFIALSFEDRRKANPRKIPVMQADTETQDNTQTQDNTGEKPTSDTAQTDDSAARADTDTDTQSAPTPSADQNQTLTDAPIDPIAQNEPPIQP
jgi:superfamily II DNA/RNA helicase